MTQLIGFILVAISLQPALAQAVVIYDSRLSAEVRFEHMPTSPLAKQLERLTETLNRIKQPDYCALEALVVIGHADPSEGNARATQELSMKRSEYIVHFLEEEGIPSSMIIAEYKGATQPVAAPPDWRNARVEMEFVGGGYPGMPCTTPVGPNGFRLRTP